MLLVCCYFVALVFDCHASVIKGFVLDSITKDPIVDARIDLYIMQTSEYNPGWAGLATTNSDKMGEFKFEHLREADYTLLGSKTSEYYTCWLGDESCFNSNDAEIISLKNDQEKTISFFLELIPIKIDVDPVDIQLPSDGGNILLNVQLTNTTDDFQFGRLLCNIAGYCKHYVLTRIAYPDRYLSILPHSSQAVSYYIEVPAEANNTSYVVEFIVGNALESKWRTINDVKIFFDKGQTIN